MVQIFNFGTHLDIIMNKVGEKRCSFFINLEHAPVARHMFPFPETERKPNTKETYLTTPFRENQLRQFSSPAVALV